MGEDTVKTLMNLCALLNTGSASKVSLVFSRANNNSQGVNDMGVVPDFLPGYLDINDQANREKTEASWGVKLSDEICKKDSNNVFDLALGNEIKALYVMGENPIVSYPNGKKVKDAFQKADFVVVQDNFLTETAQLADVVLPSSTYAEKEGTFTNMGMMVQRLTKVIEQVGDSKPDWKIVCDLAKKMGHSYSYTSPKQIMAEIGNTVPIYEGIENSNLEKEGFKWISSIYNKCKPARYKFEIPKSKPMAVKESKKYPLILLTGASLNHQGTYSRNSGSLVSVRPECYVEINRNNAQKAKINDGDMVAIESSQGKIKVKAKTTSRVPEGIVYISEDYEWVPINNLRVNGYTNVKNF